jgi:hypothetical protein
VRETYEADKVLEIDDKVKELKRTHKWFLDLASRSSKMRDQLRHDILTIRHEIQVANESQAKLEKWEVKNIEQGHITDPFVGYIHQVIITSEDEPSLILDELRLAEKYPNNTTIIHMDENGNYKVVYGLKFNLSRSFFA